MGFIYLFDLLTSVSVSIIVNCSTWLLYSGGHGVYYLYKKIKGNDEHIDKKVILDDSKYVIITREEYNNLVTHHN